MRKNMWIAFVFVATVCMCSVASAFEFKLTSPKEVGRNYQLMKLADAVLKKHNITYWACGGTLLGAIRNNGFIPWDYDCDVCIYIEDLRKLAKCKQDFDSYGVRLFLANRETMMYQIVFKDREPNEAAHLDIFFAEYDQKEGKFFHVRRFWPEHWWYPWEIGNTKRAQFGPLEISIPEFSEDHLKRGYGVDALTTGRIIYTIPNKKIRSEHLIRDAELLFKPAQYEVSDSIISLDIEPLEFAD